MAWTAESYAENYSVCPWYMVKALCTVSIGQSFTVTRHSIIHGRILEQRTHDSNQYIFLQYSALSYCNICIVLQWVLSPFPRLWDALQNLSPQDSERNIFRPGWKSKLDASKEKLRFLTNLHTAVPRTRNFPGIFGAHRNLQLDIHPFAQQMHGNWYYFLEKSIPE